MTKNISGTRFANLIHSYILMGAIAADDHDLNSKRYVFDRYYELGVECPLIWKQDEENEVDTAGSSRLSELESGFEVWEQDHLNQAAENLLKVIESDSYLFKGDKDALMKGISKVFV